MSDGLRLTPTRIDPNLCDIGFRLDDQILPRRLQDLYWTLRSRGVRSLLVLSDEPHIPWELVRPYRNDPVTETLTEEGEFWVKRSP
jgi:hypothetical protein